MPDAPEWTHLDATGAARMVDIGAKPETARSATAIARLTLQPATLAAIRDQQIAKGNVLEVARLAGIMAAKRTPDLIPLCHPLPITSVTLDFVFPDARTLQISSTVQVFARTGVEMEALTAVSIAALTVVDMVKAVDRGVEIGSVRLVHKTGGRSGDWSAS